MGVSRNALAGDSIVWINIHMLGSSEYLWHHNVYVTIFVATEEKCHPVTHLFFLFLLLSFKVHVVFHYISRQ